MTEGLESEKVLPPPPRARGAWSDPTQVQTRRSVAALIDVGIIPLVLWFVYSRMMFGGNMPLTISHVTYRAGVEYHRIGLTNGGALFVFLVIPGYLVGVFVYQRGRSGKTVGTWATGVRCVGPDGLPPGPGKALLRSVAGIPDYLLFGLVGVLLIATSTEHRHLGDRAAGTFVVAAQFAGSPVVVSRVERAERGELPPPPLRAP